MNYVLDDHGIPKVESDIKVWAEWFESADRRVAFDENAAFRVSTVFLAIDYNFDGGLPLLYETMVFKRGSSSDEDCDRYGTREEALEGHAAMVKLWLSGGTPVPCDRCGKPSLPSKLAPGPISKWRRKGICPECVEEIGKQIQNGPKLGADGTTWI